MNETQGHMALYATSGTRLRQHRIVLYLDCDRAWTARHFERNGNTGPAIARARMPAEAIEYCRARWRATSLRYNGIPPQDLHGFAEDLRNLGLDEETISLFVKQARPYLASSINPSVDATPKA